MSVLLFMANVALCQSALPYVTPVINNNDMEHMMRADRIEQREEYYESIDVNRISMASNLNAKGVAAARDGRYDEAMQDFDAAIYTSATFAGAYFNRGVIKQKLQKLADAIDDFDTAFSLVPKTAPEYFRYLARNADARFAFSDYKGAIKRYDLLLKASIYNGDAFLNRGIAQCKLKKYKEALADFNKAIDFLKNPSEAYLNKGIAEMQLKDDDGALSDLTKAKQMHSTGPVDSLMNVISPGSANEVVADTNTKAIQPEPYRVYTGPLRDNPEATRYNHIALDYAHANNMPAAIKNFSLAIAADPEFASAYNNRGFAELIMHNYKEAVDDYIKAIALDPKNVNAYSNCANALYELKDYGGAIKYFDKALHIDPANVVNYGNRGVAKRLLKDYEGAIEDFDKCLQLDPQYSQALVNKASVEFDMNNKDAACADWAKAKDMGNRVAEQFIIKNCH